MAWAYVNICTGDGASVHQIWWRKQVCTLRLSPKMQSDCSDCGPALGWHIMIANRHIIFISGQRNKQSSTNYNCRPFTEQLHSCSEVLSSLATLAPPAAVEPESIIPQVKKIAVWILNFLKRYFKTIDTIGQAKVCFSAGLSPNQWTNFWSSFELFVSCGTFSQWAVI